MNIFSGVNQSRNPPSVYTVIAGVSTVGGASIIPRNRSQFAPLILNNWDTHKSLRNATTSGVIRNTAVQPKVLGQNILPENRYAIGLYGQKGALRYA